MRATPVLAVALASATAHADLSWAPSVRTALVTARKLNRPVLVRVLSPLSNAIPPFPRLESKGIQRDLREYVLVRASSYDELRTVARNLPVAGGSGLVLLDSRGALLKRFGGFIHDTDVAYVVQRGCWRLRQQQAFSSAGGKPKSDPHSLASLATIRAMDGDIRFATQTLQAHGKSMSPAGRAMLAEAIADERRAQGDVAGAISSYRLALSGTNDPETTCRLKLHLAICQLRNGEPDGAKLQVNQVLRTRASEGTRDYAAVILRSLQGEGFGPRSFPRAIAPSRTRP